MYREPAPSICHAFKGALRMRNAKKTTLEARAIPAERASRKPSSQRVNKRPKETGKVLWKTIAPVMLPRAKVSLLSLSQITELNFSGSSVARGASTKEIKPAGIPTDSEADSTAWTKKWAPNPITSRVPRSCTTTAQVGAWPQEDSGQSVRSSGDSP